MNIMNFQIKLTGKFLKLVMRKLEFRVIDTKKEKVKQPKIFRA